MATRNTRTFTDLDLNFVPSPMYSVINEGIGLITTSTSSDIVVGTNTVFTKYDMLYRNLLVNGVFIGKVKDTIDSTHVQLFKNANASITAQNFRYSNPSDLVLRFNENAIKASVKNLIMTMNYERRFHPEIGSQVNSLLFEPATPLLSAVMERTIRHTIDNFEPRVTLNDVSVKINPDNNAASVSIMFTILNTQTPQTLQFALERTR
jgi:phage baseplate assembly protein W